MLDFRDLRDQFDAFSDYQAEEQKRRAWQLEEACDVLSSCDGDWRSLRREASAADTSWLVARLRSAPAGTCAAAERPTPITVVATDGSQIYPDRHVEPNCFLLNVSRVAFQYGTTEPPVMDAEADFHFRRDELADLFDQEAGAISAEVVSAMRDEWELRMLLETAREARADGRPIMALADGTLIRWMLRGMRNPDIEEQLIENYTGLLEEFRKEEIPLASYVSMPANTEVVNLLRVLRGEASEEPPERELEGLVDRWVFRRTLDPGERTAVFESASHIQSEYGDDPICYFYVSLPAPGRSGSEIGRVEMPRWIADSPRHVEHLHALICDECKKGGGYPMILSEAHEEAVIRASEREQFYHHLEYRARERDVPYRTSRKRAAKQRPMA